MFVFPLDEPPPAEAAVALPNALAFLAATYLGRPPGELPTDPLLKALFHLRVAERELHRERLRVQAELNRRDDR